MAGLRLASCRCGGAFVLHTFYLPTYKPGIELPYRRAERDVRTHVFVPFEKLPRVPRDSLMLIRGIFRTKVSKEKARLRKCAETCALDRRGVLIRRTDAGLYSRSSSLLVEQRVVVAWLSFSLLLSTTHSHEQMDAETLAYPFGTELHQHQR